MRGRIVRYHTKTWGLSLIYDLDQDELSAQGVCGGAAMYNARVLLSGDDRLAVRESRMDFDQLDRRICRDGSFKDYLPSPIAETDTVETLDELLAAMSQVNPP
jgi:hypothetical protein